MWFLFVVGIWGTESFSLVCSAQWKAGECWSGGARPSLAAGISRCRQWNSNLEAEWGWAVTRWEFGTAVIPWNQLQGSADVSCFSPMEVFCCEVGFLLLYKASRKIIWELLLMWTINTFLAACPLLSLQTSGVCVLSLTLPMCTIIFQFESSEQCQFLVMSLTWHFHGFAPLWGRGMCFPLRSLGFGKGEV